MQVRLQEKYKNEIIKVLKDKFNYKNDMQIPRLEKIVINMGVGEAVKDSKKIGKVTSAVYSPRLKKNIALAIVEINNSEIGNNLKVILNDNEISCKVIEKPFYHL